MVETHIQAAIEALKNGELIVVVDDDNREAEGDLVGVANLASAENVNFMVQFARGLLCVPVTKRVAERLNLTSMVVNNTETFGTAFTISIDHRETTTGISAFDRAKTIKAVGQADSRPTDFNRPGHIFPLVGSTGGIKHRRGHTEAGLALANLANQSEAAYICEILNDDGTMARKPQLEIFAQKHHLPLITIADLVTYLNEQDHVTVTLPTEFGDFELILFEDQQGRENLLLTKGNLRETKEPLLVRVHSECFTGDVLGSYRCDCGPQLHEAMRLIEARGRGAIIYLRQEGRGIGLKNKLRAYRLQEQGLDTVEANLALGFQADERNYQFAVKILKEIGAQKIDLLTNNPDKVAQLTTLGIDVHQRIPLEITARDENRAYLKTKKVKFHHLLTL